MASQLDNAADLFPPISLAEVLDIAALQTRWDNKYLLSTEAAGQLLVDISDGQVLQIGPRRRFRYRSVYFDTPELHSYRQHRQGHRRRFKIRTRSYLDTGQTVLEVKSQDGRGRTVKHRTPVADPDRLSPAGIDFAVGCGVPPAVGSTLGPVLVTEYLRTTLVTGADRITFDARMVVSTADRHRAAPDGLVLVETKSAAAGGPVDRQLRRLGARPQSLSKYCIGIALTHPELPANPWHRVLHKYFRA